MCLTLNVQNFLNPKGGCMKKLVVLALVLCMATMASAALKISVNGVVDGTVILAPSQTATLAISTNSIVGFANGDWNGWALVAQTSLADITGGAVATAYAAGGTLEEPGLSIQGTVAGAGMTDSLGTLTGQEGIAGTLNVTGSNINPSILFDSFIIHCDGVGPTVVSLFGTNDYDTFQFLGSVTITQTPEPITMTLLGLGGLFLRRRSK
jgi:hypothetical protein